MLTTCFVGGVKISISDYKKEAGKDPLCALGHRLVAKKGKKVIHHFAHYPGQGCDALLWHKGMTNWHSQWQKIVLDKSNVEVCLDPNGNIVGISSFHGGNVTSHVSNPQMSNPALQMPTYSAALASTEPTSTLMYSQSSHKMIPVVPNNASQFLTQESHIADIIRPSRVLGGRPLIVEIQHSSISKDTIDTREAYYKNMIWLFDTTPRVTTREKCNKIAYVDGKICYLKEKVTYVCLITAPSAPSYSPLSPVEKCLGDECQVEFLTPIGGSFIIINSRTKYWYDTTTPTYFDCGFGILRLLKKLDKGFAITLYITYEQFMIERMPVVNEEEMKNCSWFHSIPLMQMMKLNLLPKPIDVSNITLCRNRIIIKYNGNELNGLGLERGAEDWHGGEFYGQGITSTLISAGEKGKKKTMNGLNPSIEQNDDLMAQLIRQAQGGMFHSSNLNNNLNNDNNLKDEALLITRLRKFLGVSNAVNIELTNMKGLEVIVIHCNKETYSLRDKFKTLGMLYKKNTGKKASSAASDKGKQSPYYWAKAVDVENKLNSV
jgi:hypothetical protein